MRLRNDRNGRENGIRVTRIIFKQLYQKIEWDIKTNRNKI